VALDEVGMILSREVSRLSRTDKDWCHLMEVCQMFGTLIADADNIYDLASMDDQLILGIKGTLSVVELKILRSRLQQGQEEKARRGELMRLVAPGYKCVDSCIVKDPDLRVQEAIHLVFKKYRELWSARQTHKWFIDNEVRLPVNRRGNGKTRIDWQLPAQTFIRSILHNPIYAGAYVYGQRQGELTLRDGQIVKRQGASRRPEECRVFIPNHHEGYVSWEEFEENQKRLRNSALRFRGDESVSAIRKGHGLLSGLLRCGRCGRKLHVRYWGKRGTVPRYLCAGDFQGGGGYCIGFGGGPVDRRFADIVLEAISPYGVEASLKALTELNTEVDSKHALLQRELQQHEYEAQRAFEQYNAVDARNRLVAVELEQRWNATLEKAVCVKKRMEEICRQRQAVTAEQAERVLRLGSSFKQVWESGSCPMELKKRIIRTVIHEIVVSLDEQTQVLHFVIHWNGGSHTEFFMDKPMSTVGKTTDVQDVELIRKMADLYDDAEIARVLNKLKRKTCKGLPWNQTRVASVRSKHGMLSAPNSPQRGKDIFSLAQAAEFYSVSDTTIRKLVEAKVLPMTQAAPWAPWEILRADLETEPVRGIIERLRRTGKLNMGIVSQAQQGLFTQNQ
jgi:hypothetical protein